MKCYYVYTIFRVEFRALSADGTGSCPSDENIRLRSEVRIPLVHKEAYSSLCCENAREVFILKKNEIKKGFYPAKVITASGLLTAASVILATVAKYIFNESALRLTVECLPIFIGAFAFGPIVGGAIAIGADLISCVIAGMAPNPLITIGACYVGVCAGVAYKYCFTKRFQKIRIVFAVFIGHIVGSMIIKTLALQIYYRMGIIVLFRVPIYIAIATIESIVLCILFKNKGLKHEITGE